VSEDLFGKVMALLLSFLLLAMYNLELYTANVCRDLRGVYREIGVRGFQIYGDCM